MRKSDIDSSTTGPLLARTAARLYRRAVGRGERDAS